MAAGDMKARYFLKNGFPGDFFHRERSVFLGMAPYCGYLVSFAVGFAAMTGQIWFCRWWLERHRYGVLEGLWHRATWLAAGKVSAPEHR